jgi:50S ribosomal protein L16 3-hydroxylase
VGLNADSSGFTLSINAVDVLRDHLGHSLSTSAFSKWLAEFFTGSSSEDTSHYSERDDTLSLPAFTKALEAKAGLIKPAYVKFALTSSPEGGYSLGFNCNSFDINDDALAVILSLMKENAVTTSQVPALLDHLDLLCTLYNNQALDFLDRPT